MEKRQLPFLTVVALAHLIKTHEVSPVAWIINQDTIPIYYFKIF